VTFDFFIEYFSAIFCLMPVFACSCQRGASQLEAAFAGYGAPEALNAYPPYCDRDDVSRRSFSEGGRLGVVGLRLL
jgi:hypothetical protein